MTSSPPRARADQESAARKARGERLAALREHFRLSQGVVSSLAGIQRTQYVTIEGGSYGWRSRRPVEGLARVYGVLYEQFMAYVDGDTRLDDIIALARPAIENIRLRIEETERTQSDLGALLDQAEAKTPLVNGVREAVSAPVVAGNLLAMPSRAAIAEILRINAGFAKTLGPITTAQLSGTRKTHR